jgi:SNF2 family DNA or RNA helicase
VTGFQYRPYQLDAIDRGVERKSLLLALTMGAGKTATVIGTVMRLRDEGKVRSGLVFALNSTKFQWLREIRKVDPTARAIVVDGDKAQRQTVYRHAKRYHYVILHYECLVNDWDEIKRYAPTDFIIGDEITAIKGFDAKRSRKMKALGKQSEYRYGLSGQPVENRPEELFSIMEFIDPKVLGPFDKFDRTFIERDHFGRPKRYHNLKTLHEAMQDAMFRKSREDIKEWLPEVVTMEMPVVLDSATMRLHDLIKADLIAAIDKAVASGAGGGFDLASHYGKMPKTDNAQLKGEVMSRLLAMRMLSSHPQLLLKSAEDFDSPDTAAGSAYAALLKREGILDKVPSRSTKLDALLETIQEILAEDPLHKVVVFSYFKPMLAMMETELSKLRIGHTKITGDIPSSDRDRRIKEFNNHPNCRVFLSSDAGAYGVDLNRGSHLICYDLPWSAGVLSQRISRIDRTSSSFKSITIMYLYGQNTIEERMIGQLQQKLAVAGAFLDGKFDLESGSLPLDYQSLKEFLQQ